MINPHDRPQNFTCLAIFCHQHGYRSGVPVGPEEFRRHRNHSPLSENDIDRISIGLRGKTADVKSRLALTRGTIHRKIQPIGVGWIQKVLLRRLRQHHVRITHVECDIALIWPLLAHLVDEIFGGFEGVAENQPPPAAIQSDILMRKLVR